MITAADGPVVEHGAVLVRDGRVAAVGPVAELATGGVEHLAFPGTTVLPGLVNAHVHLAFDVLRDPVPALRDAAHEALRATVVANAHAQLAAGITTVRDLGDRDGLVGNLRDDVAAGRATGPRVLNAGAPITIRGGHCWFLGGEVDATPASVRAAVQERAAQGVDVVKVMAGGGQLTPTGPSMWESQFGLDELRAVVEAAREVGLPVAAHAHGTEAIGFCARAGVDTIEHAGWYAAEGRRECSDEVAELVAASGAVVVPTRFRGWTTWPDETLEAHLGRQRWMDRHGIATIVGNDAGAGQGYFDDLHEAMTLYAAVGWTPTQVLAAATSRSAAVLGLGDRVGRLAPGYAADVLVVDGDPLADLAALRRVRSVLAAGVPVDL